MFRRFAQPNILLIGIIAGALLLVYILMQSILSRLHAKHYVIESVLFTSGTIQNYDNDEFLLDIVSMYSWAYYSTLRLWSTSSQAIKSFIKEKEFLEDVRYLSFEDNKLVIDVIFRKPLVRLVYNSGSYALYDHSILELPAESTIAKDVPSINLPLYLSGSSESIDGILYEVIPSKMLADYYLLQSAVVRGSISYIPGAQRYVIWRPEIQIYINAKKDIIEQLQTLFVLKEHYPWFESLQTIDLGSLKQPIIK